LWFGQSILKTFYPSDLAPREFTLQQPPRVRHGPDQEVAAEAPRAAVPERSLVHVSEALPVDRRERELGGDEQAFDGDERHTTRISAAATWVILHISSGSVGRMRNEVSS
jgi:hypothetical protein